MFSLQKMLDEIGPERQERRVALRHRERQIKAIERAYDVNLGKLKTLFPVHREERRTLTVAPHIEVRELEAIGVHALLVRQTIEVAQVPRYISIIRGECDETSWQVYERGALRTLLKHDEALSGTNMRLLTNDAELVHRLADSGFNPPGTWLAFYELGPFVGSLQGNAAYWYSQLWDPYWGGLSLVEQTEFLEKQRLESTAYMSDEEWQGWVDRLGFRDSRICDSLSSNNP
ncbi:hypothetical protein LFL96_12485 [Paraburkholderia sp. D15]|uniref:hypothetical protein n=1 Tax=Paraburkholderia sp. D15 TaxID=2880218 RepID=UPI0024791DE3|nr:hypothetical protein [Paraburkholderia sp. D15]WGS48607.1 hypothetical protein LFL96_12485 [Paraburkholderia sp. D15]